MNAAVEQESLSQELYAAMPPGLFLHLPLVVESGPHDLEKRVPRERGCVTYLIG